MTAIHKGMVFANVVLFQLGWFACVLSAAHGVPWAGTALAFAVVAWHLWSAARPLEEIQLLLQVVLIGALWDSLLVMLGWVAYPSGTLLTGAAPHWIVALWALFATTLNLSMRWLKPRLGVSAVLGAISGPFAYWGAMRLGAVEFVSPLQAIIALALGWSLLMPALLLLSQRYDGFDLEAREAT